MRAGPWEEEEREKSKTEKAIMERRMYPHEQAAGLEMAQMREPTWPFLRPHYLNGEPSVLLGFLENLPYHDCFPLSAQP